MSLHGTPPEKLFWRDLEFYLIVKNEFKSLKVPFVLKIKISLTFALKLLKQYGPYILTMIGLIVYANKIYNILCKKRYRYPKDIFVNVGEEIHAPRIAFIRQEKIEAQRILKQLRLNISRELNKGSIKNIDLAKYFLDEEGLTLDKIKLREKVEEVLRKTVNQKKLGQYKHKVKTGQNLVDRLIFGQLCLWYLENDKEAKNMFDKIKDQWTELVDWDDHALCRINESQFNKLISERQDLNHSSLKEELISRDMNMDLLKDVIEAYAMNNQHVDYSMIGSHIVVKEKVGTNILKEFLKLDLKNINLSEKGKMGYGIAYKIQNDQLSFYGVPEENFDEKTMVLQITDNRHRILKELWFVGVSKDIYDEGKTLEFSVRNEDDAKGQVYEVY